MKRIAVVEHVNIPDDLPQLEECIQELNAKLVVIDPLMCFVSLNANKEQAMRQALTPLRELAERRDVAIVLVRHLNKSGGGHALYRGTGSIAITAAVRSAFLVGNSPRDPNLRVLCHIKSNLGPKSPSLLFEPVAPDGTLQIAWRGECEYTAWDLLKPPKDTQWARAEARQFLEDVLADGPVAHRSVAEQASERGLALRTLERAKMDLGVVSRRKGFGAGSTVFWELPKTNDEDKSSYHSPPTAKLAVYDD